jgi:hypothetical protein
MALEAGADLQLEQDGVDDRTVTEITEMCEAAVEPLGKATAIPYRSARETV